MGTVMSEPREPTELPRSGEDVVFAPSPFRRVRDGLSGPLSGQGSAFGVVAAGGALGALGRYGMSHVLPTVPGRFPLGTFLTNVVGGLAIGVLIVLLTELHTPHPLARPFLVTGILGGFTTFSTYTVETEQLLERHAVGTALGYLFGTLASALLATWLGVAATRALGKADR
jgi:CrcB protein